MGCLVTRIRLLAVALGVVMGVMTAGCRASQPAATASRPSLENEIAAEMARVSAVPWSASRPLAWSDFKGAAPDSGSEGALTVYSLFHGMRCTGDTFNFQVTAGFLPIRSWVKATVVNDQNLANQTLAHEQTHFDLSEVHARRMRKYFAELYDPCGRTEAALEAGADGFIRGEAAAQARYDQETAHGRRGDVQRTWGERVRDDLASLVRYRRDD